MTLTHLDVSLPAGGFAPTDAARAVREAGLERAVHGHERGPFGPTSRGLATLEAAHAAADLALCAASRLTAALLGAAPSLREPELSRGQAVLVGAFTACVLADDARERLAALAPSPEVSGALELDGLDTLLALGAQPRTLVTRVLGVATRFLGSRHQDDAPATVIAAFLELLRRAVLELSRGGSLAPLVEGLRGARVSVAGRPYDGLEGRRAAAEASALLPFRPEDIVGNEDYLAAGLRLARDVAGFDLEEGRNPKRVNPVLFGLGRPGCGKTVTAHAIGNYFLDYCRTRDVPARFVVVRRTDWASSYQNASAANLVRIFKEEVYGFDGVAGVYWGDIDTAFASRDQSGLRMEEQQNLAAVFGIFDGTLLPKDGKWFMICDANTLHMDEATISRIAQNPFTVRGPTTPDDYITLMRDLMLRDVRRFLPTGDESWRALGERCVALDLSGRAVEAVANNVRALIQDFEYPDAYFELRGEARAELLATLGTPVAAEAIAELLDRWVAFHRDAEERAAQERFDREVAELVRQLNAGRAAAARAVEGASAEP